MNLYKLTEKGCSNAKIVTYPDGQRNLLLDLSYICHKEDTIIKCRIKDFNTLEVLLLLVGALKRQDIDIKEIQIVYLFGLRSDRVFEIGMPNYVKDVLKPILSSMNVPIKVFYPHAHKLMEHLYLQDPTSALEGIKIGGDQSTKNQFNVADCFYKTRDINGNIELKLTKSLRFLLHQYTNITIIDDLCDGGYTFIKAAQLIKQECPNSVLRLGIIHGIFSKGFEELLNYYTEILTTNSYQDFKEVPKNVKIVEVI